MAFNIWDWEKKPKVKGRLVAKLNNMPPYSKKLYGWELENGEVWYSWGYYQLVGFFAKLPFHSIFEVRYLGKGPSDDRPNSQPNMKHFDCKIISLPAKSKKATKLEAKLQKMREAPPGTGNAPPSAI